MFRIEKMVSVIIQCMKGGSMRRRNNPLTRELSLIFLLIVFVLCGCSYETVVTLQNNTQDNLKLYENGPHIPVGGKKEIGSVWEDPDDKGLDEFDINIYRGYGCLAEIHVTGVTFPTPEQMLLHETVVLTEDPRDTFHAQTTKGYVTVEIRECIEDSFEF